MAVMRLIVAALMRYILWSPGVRLSVHAFCRGPYLFGTAGACLHRIRIRVMSRRSLNVYQHDRPGLRLAERNPAPFGHRQYWENSLQRGVGSCVLRKPCRPGEYGLIYNGESTLALMPARIPTDGPFRARLSSRLWC